MIAEYQGLQVPVINDLTFELASGECLALCGPSGSGKTTAMRALFGLTPAQLQVRGTRLYAGGCPAHQLGRRVPGGIAFILQEPAANFAPHLEIGTQLSDINSKLFPLAVPNWAARLGLQDLPRLLRQLPDQCSGGELQRLALIAALLQAPGLLVADEPTAALDAAGRAGWCALVRELLEQGLAVLLATHDPTVLAGVATRRLLLDSVAVPPHTGPAAHSASRARETVPGGNLLEIQLHGRQATPSRAAEPELAFSVAKAGCTALVGPSGSGKSSVLHLALGLPTPYSGSVRFAGSALQPWPDASRRHTVGRMATVLQDSRQGLNPHLTVSEIVVATLRRTHRRRSTCVPLAEAKLEALGIGPGLWNRRPADLSVGQAQRVALVEALAVGPELLVADEPTSAQDARSRVLVVACLLQARQEQGMALLLATHDLELVSALGATLITLEAHARLEQADLPPALL